MADVELEPAEANSAYDCLKGDMKNSYAKSGLDEAGYYLDWKIFSTAPYASGTHGGRHVSNYANAVAEEAYAKYEENGKMPVGSVLAKDSFAVQTDGRAVVGPLFLMEKMAAGFNADSMNWKYTLILPNGQVVGTTNGKGSDAVKFCYECHLAAEDTDSLFFLPEDLRVN
ncbi:MAG: cytochrome P460 family protein [Proteobacteria bacterium]|nr:cytochrome P460 family protein [Pseudomonadota bacterium]